MRDAPNPRIFFRQPRAAGKKHLIQQVWVKGFSGYEETRSMDNLGPRYFLGLSLGLLMLLPATGCHRDLNAAQTASAANNSGPDPADANLAPVPNNNQPRPASAPQTQGAVLGVRYQAQPQQSYEQYPPQQYPSQQTAPPPSDQDQAYQDAQTAEQLDEEGETPPVEYADEPPPPLPV
jgi:hypothetical protein